MAQPTAGKLAEVLGARRVFLAGIVFVLLGGVLGSLGQNLAVLTVARVLIGLGTSAAFPCAMVMIRRRAQQAGLDQPPGGVLGGLAIAGTATAAIGPPHRRPSRRRGRMALGLPHQHPGHCDRPGRLPDVPAPHHVARPRRLPRGCDLHRPVGAEPHGAVLRPARTGLQRRPGPHVPAPGAHPARRL
ncbi:MFS transporter [Streptomyces sp. ADI92-24]|uniref:MFS transporter n=1 Tax=Streptomyces sp. ADI92-24 TaxID=1522756 RepID=UPI001F14CD3C|nr:MFS transporter [Streptomyces sp. ADI92-24]